MHLISQLRNNNPLHFCGKKLYDTRYLSVGYVSLFTLLRQLSFHSIKKVDKTLFFTYLNIYNLRTNSAASPHAVEKKSPLTFSVNLKNVQFPPHAIGIPDINYVRVSIKNKAKNNLLTHSGAQSLRNRNIYIYTDRHFKTIILGRNFCGQGVATKINAFIQMRG